MHRPETTWIPGPIRVRHQPPTIEEAVAAAEAVTGDPDQQAEFAAGLMGVPVEDVRPYLKPPAPVRRYRLIEQDRPRATMRGAVIVERKVRRSVRPG